MFFLIISLIIIALVISIIRITNVKYEKFVFNHSISIKNVKEINSKYIFKSIPNFDMKHSYDNEKFYKDISTKDYLIYNLVENQNRVKEAIKNTAYNKSTFLIYKKEIDDSLFFDKYDTDVLLKNKKKLSRVEKRILNRLIKKPTIEFSIKVRLLLTKINGSIRTYKRDVFYVDCIEDIIYRLNQKKGNYYNDGTIWEAICRVERGKVSNKLRFAIYKRDKHRCKRCGSYKNLEIDHIFPISKGGKSVYTNLQTLCHNCNVNKSNQLPKDQETQKICPKCGEKMLLKIGKYGKFYGCSNYPKCNYIWKAS